MRGQTTIRLRRDSLTPSSAELRRHNSVRLALLAVLILCAAGVGVAISQIATRQDASTWKDAAGFNLSRPAAGSVPSPF